MTTDPPISVSTTPFPPCPKPNLNLNGSASTSTSTSPLLSKVLAPAASRPNGLSRGGLADKETIGICEFWCFELGGKKGGGPLRSDEGEREEGRKGVRKG